MSLPYFWRLLLVAWLALVIPGTAANDSICYGTTANGRLENGVQLPKEGRNFHAYSTIGSLAGRTYVHNKVREVVLTAYRALEQTAQNKVYVYGETGHAEGGKIKPHKTHQNGLSVDFMVPVLDKSKKSVPLPTNALNKWGYDIEFNNQGRYQSYVIDFDAMAEHLNELEKAAAAQHIKIALVIFDPALQRLLFQTKKGVELEKRLNFMKTPAWVRHDEHYHVDFSIPCRPL